MQSIFAISRRFKKRLASPMPGINTDPPLEYGGEEYWELLNEVAESYGEKDEAGQLVEEITSKLDQDKFYWKISQAIIDEIRHSGLSYLPDVVQLSLDGETSIWVKQIDKKSYEPVSKDGISTLSLDGVTDSKLVDYVNNFVADSGPDAQLPDVIVGDQDGKQIIFVRKYRGSVPYYERSNSGVIPVYLELEKVLKIALRFREKLKSLGVDLESDFDFEDLDRGGTLVSEPDRSPYRGSPSIDIPIEYAADEPLFSSAELEWVAKAVAFSLKSPEVQSRPEYTEALLGIFNKVRNALERTKQ